MQTVTLAEAQAHLPELLQVLEPGEELAIVAGGQTLALVKKMRPETEGIDLKRTAVKNRRASKVDEPGSDRVNALVNETNPAYTERQGQFLAFIHQYRIFNGCAPAEADMQRFFKITPPSVHSMVLTLEQRGFIRRTPGQARSIALIVPPESLPLLKRI